MRPQEADRRITTRAASAHPDPSFPRLHGRPGWGWLNDPHGCIAIDGRYHVFFQHNPDRPYHEDIRWGHISSTDLAHWHDEPIALLNRPGELDEFGCWTGSVIDDDGTPTDIYSAVADASDKAVVMLARSDRSLRTWHQERHPACGLPRHAAVSHARDPFVFELDGRRFGIQGAGNYTRSGDARVLVYACDDITSWTELGTLVSSQDDAVAADIAPADVWECPNLVRFSDRWVLILSLWRRAGGPVVAEGVRYLVGDLRLTADGPRFKADSGGLIDDGPSFYAPHVLREHERTLIWGWAREHGRSQAEIDAAGWAGSLTFCRELRLIDDVLVSQPAAELTALRRNPLDLVPDIPFTANAFDIELRAGAGAASLWLLDDAGQRLVAECDIGAAPLAQPRILVDGSMVEIFDGSGIASTTRAYPTTTSAWMLSVARADDVSAWMLAP